MRKTCKRCGKYFSATRDDATYCTGACGAQGWRNGDTHTHAEKAHEYVKECDYCHKGFSYNAYAERGGKRAPRFCSAKCRVAQHRADHKANPVPPGGYASQDHNDEDYFRKAGPTPKTGKTDFKNLNRYEVLGVSGSATQAQIRAAYLKLIKLWHTDTNHAPEALEMCKRINWAYDGLKEKPKNRSR